MLAIAALLAVAAILSIVLAAFDLRQDARGSTTTAIMSKPPTTSVVNITKSHIFLPFIVVIAPNTLITWTNGDDIAHDIFSTPITNAFLNPDRIALTVPAGSTVALTLPKPGVYNYYDDTMAQWSKTDQRPIANLNSPTYPEAMEGVIWVQGPISLPTSANNLIPPRDLFQSYFVAVAMGGTVSWHNTDTDKHVITLVTGWQAPINPVSLDIIYLNGTVNAPPNGETKTFTFTTPGLYYYYCATHADLDPVAHRAIPHIDSSEYPIPMDGFVLVVG